MFGLLARKREGEIDAEIERLRQQHHALHDYMTGVSLSFDAHSS